MVDEAYWRYQRRLRGIYTVVVKRIVRTSETTIEIEAGSEEDARFDAVIDQANGQLPADKKVMEDYDYDIDESEVGPKDRPERDPDDARDARAGSTRFRARPR